MADSTKIEGIEEVNRRLENIPRNLIARVVSAISRASIVMQTYTKGRMTGGTTATNLRSHPGDRLRSSVMVQMPRVTDTTIDGGIFIGGFGLKYARVQVGERADHSTVITPRNRQWLTVPLKEAMTPSGAPRGTAQNGPWGKTFIQKSKRGNLIIFGQRKITMPGKRQGQLRNAVVPLFVLRKSVTVPVRIGADEILTNVIPKITADLTKIGVGVEG